MKIGFDIGGVLSKYPSELKQLLTTLHYGWHDLYVITDQHPKEQVIETLQQNGFYEVEEADQHYCLISFANVYCADYEKYGNMAKAILIKEFGIQIFIDDFEGYLQWDSSLGPQPLLLKVQPDMFKPYWAESWKVEGNNEFGRKIASRPQSAKV